jgi:hypothetical protein
VFVYAATWVDDFAPVLVETEYSASVPDPVDPLRGLATGTGDGVSYTDRVDVLVVDEFDAYWILRHRLVTEYTPVDRLAADDRASAAYWAWEPYYLSLTATGTIDNELRAGPSEV